MRKKVSAMLEIVVCDDDIADLERAVNMLHKILQVKRLLIILSNLRLQIKCLKISATLISEF